MTRKTLSRTKRELESLRRATDPPDEDGPPTVRIELAGLPPDTPREADAERPTRDDVAGFEEFRVDLASGAVETPGLPSTDDLPGCASAGCPNPAMPSADVCEKCMGMPRRDWRSVVRENDRGDDCE